MSRRLNITDEIYGRLQVIITDWYKTNLTRKGTYWWCQCECGNIVSVFVNNLRSGNTQSCGCLHKEKISERLDITNEIYGRLLALVTDWYKTKETGITHWFCQCEDNNIVSVSIANLKNGHTKSCGCLRNEKSSKRMLKRNKTYKGENHPSWKGDIASMQAFVRTSKKYKEFHKQVLKRDNYICQVSKERGGSLQVHHIKSFSKILEENNIITKKQVMNCEELWDMNNAITLSEKWHSGIKTNNLNAFHKLYGNFNFTEEDFYEWFEKFSLIEKIFERKGKKVENL